MFQSLFLWNSLNGCGTPWRRRSAHGVSILVFVEFAQRRESRTRPSRWKSWRFNPCFCGIRSTADRGERAARVSGGFQSLFLWNSLNGFCEPAPTPTAYPTRFNPCFCGIRSTASLHAGSSKPCIGFNPCFCGIRSTATSPSRIERTPEAGFNPCFCGIRSTARFIPLCRSGASSSFNPCFCGIRSTASLSANGAVNANWVSILVFVEFAQRQTADLGPRTRSRFQSLFLWNSLNGGMLRECRSARDRVSILVFVEFAQRQTRPAPVS